MSPTHERVWQRGEWQAYLESHCPDYESHCWGNECIVLYYNGNKYRHWHMRRLLGRNRSSFECLLLAIKCVAELDAWKQRQEDEAALLREQAAALREVAADMETV